MRRSRSITSIVKYSALFALAISGTGNIQSAYAEGHVSNPLGSGFYFSGFIGAGFAGDSAFSGVVTPPGGEQTVAIDFDTNVNFGGSAGLYLGSFGTESWTPRVELELSHLKTDADTIDFSGNGVGNENNVGGDISRTLLMANAFIDINTESALTPYIGGGLGLAFTDVDIVYGGPVGAPPPIAFRESDTNFAAQAIIGVSYALTENMSVFADGRYTRVFDVSGPRFNPAGLTGNIEDDVDNLSVNIGLRFGF